MAKTGKNTQKLQKLLPLLRECGRRLLIVVQDQPDPDAIAAALGLKYLANSLAGCICTVACGGEVGRAENRALVKYLDLPLRPIGEIDPAQFGLAAMVDTQPGTGNNSFPGNLLPRIVIDHHPRKSASRAVEFTDIRSGYGATSTILHEYLEAAGLSPDKPLATALLYGIRSDTQDLGRESTQADMAAILALYPLANLRLLSRISQAQLAPEYFRILSLGMRRARVFGRAAVVNLGKIAHPDTLSELADFFLRREDIAWVLCFGTCGTCLRLSMRTSETERPAGQLLARVVGRLGSAGGACLRRRRSDLCCRPDPAADGHARGQNQPAFPRHPRHCQNSGAKIYPVNGLRIPQILKDQRRRHASPPGFPGCRGAWERYVILFVPSEPKLRKKSPPWTLLPNCANSPPTSGGSGGRTQSLFSATLTPRSGAR